MFENILIFRTDRIGDLIYSCPTIVTIKKNIKNSKITLIASTKNYEYAKSLNLFDDVYIFPKKGIFKKIKFIYFLSKKKFKHALALDGKDRSLLSLLFIKSNNKISISNSKLVKLINFFKIKVIINNGKSNFLSLFNEVLEQCGIDKKVENFEFLSNKKDNGFSTNIKINDYIHIHLDEKWKSNLYIKDYTDINLKYIEFVSFLEQVAINNNILITTGLIDYDFLDNLVKNYFVKKNNNIYKKNLPKNCIYFIDKPSFEDLESLLKNSKMLISCHCALTHVASSFNLKIIDIIEKRNKLWYGRWTNYMKNYQVLFRDEFSKMKPELINKILNN